MKPCFVLIWGWVGVWLGVVLGSMSQPATQGSHSHGARNPASTMQMPTQAAVNISDGRAIQRTDMTWFYKGIMYIQALIKFFIKDPCSFGLPAKLTVAHIGPLLVLYNPGTQNSTKVDPVYIRPQRRHRSHSWKATQRAPEKG